MSDWPIIAVRLALFADLGLLFGIPLFALYALGEAERREPALIPVRSLVTGLAVGGIGLSILGFALQSAAMAGTTIAGLDPALLTMLVGETATGWAFQARMIALLAAFGFGVVLSYRHGAACAGAIALATLAWSGHGAATEGAAGWIHLLADIVHLLASAAWLGALLVLLLLVANDRDAVDAPRVRAAHRALAGFSVAGTVIVALIVATGLINGAFLIGADHVLTLAATPYGQLLIVKLMLFGAMLCLAALNRYRLTPKLEAALEAGTPQGALALLRRSLAVEASLALLIFALVAWLGTLAPPASGS